MVQVEEDVLADLAPAHAVQDPSSRGLLQGVQVLPQES